ncbi:hypothetical protein Ahy_A02g005291 [Arachis hypogaea]|uniref:Uncharacterized protein n=1 Tax=Arachis hypogaea TaxID=3818 RepID=A0A445E6P9_ARAHY|nr:hypothetical protein Ahy_A02g005291 [Arachis hypogaea]
MYGLWGEIQIFGQNPNEFMLEIFLEINSFWGRKKNLSYGTIGLYYIVLGTLVHGYDWKLVNGQKAKDLDMSENFGLTLHKAQSLQAIPIKN